MRPRSTTPTDQELRILKIVWQRGSATVRDVYETLLSRRRIAYTSVMTTMKIMEEKGYLTKRLEGRAHVYEAARSKNQMVGAMVREFLQRVFNGSAEQLLAHLVEERRLSDKELKRIARMIRESK